MYFIHSFLVWGFLLTLLPLLIHLINRLRHRRVAWAAMQFLQTSFRKNQRWVWLKQWILIALRMLAIATVVALLARLVTQDQWLRWFGGQTTHHIVVLDDSLSMGDRSQGGASAYERARRAVEELVSTVQKTAEPHQLTLLRTSRAADWAAQANEGSATSAERAGGDADPTASSGTSSESSPTSSDNGASATTTTPTPPIADLRSVPIRAGMNLFAATDEVTTRLAVPSQRSLRLSPALDLLERWIPEVSAERYVVHLLSDFRQADWQEVEPLREQLARLERRVEEIHLVRCAVPPETNLSVVSLQPDYGTRAAGVPVMMRVAVKNHGDAAVSRVTLQVQTEFYPTGPTGNEGPAERTDLPSVVFDRIEPGATVTRQFQVFFATRGQHVVQVALPSDPLSDDNRRYYVLSLEGAEGALLIDGDDGQRSAYYLSAIFAPGSLAKTGIQPQTQSARYLRDATIEELVRYPVIYLLDVPALEPRAATNLSAYLQRGGGVVAFLGPLAQPTYYAQAYNDGWFPAPIAGPTEWKDTGDTTGADVIFRDHPMFRAMQGSQNPFAAAIRMRRYHLITPGWKPTEDQAIETLATLRNGHPLVLQRRVGDGHCVALLTSLAPDWNNWALDPSLIVATLQLHAYLATAQRAPLEQLVAAPLSIEFPVAEYRPELRFIAPALAADVREWTTTATEVPASTPALWSSEWSADREPPGGAREWSAAGILDAQLETLTGQVHHRRFAVNVDTGESPLELVDAAALKQKLAPLDIRIRSAEQGLDLAGLGQSSGWSPWLLALALGLLILEQGLAYRWSYHPPATSWQGGTSA